MPAVTAHTLLRPPALAAPRVFINRWVAAAALAALALGAGILPARRLAGALARPLSASELLALGAAVGVAAACVSCLRFRRAAAAEPTWYRFISRMVWPALAIAAVGASVSLPETHAAALAAYWIAAPMVAGAGSYLLSRGNRTAVGRADAHSADSFEPRESQIVRQAARWRGADGADFEEGRLTADFSAGQRRVYLHVVFCPPFARLPRLEARQADGPRARVSVARLFAHAARIEVRLECEPSRAEQVVVDYKASDSVDLGIPHGTLASS